MNRRNFLGQFLKGVGAAIIGSGLLERCTIADLAAPNTPCTTPYTNSDVVTYILNGQKYWYRQSELKKYQEFMEEREKELFSYLKF